MLFRPLSDYLKLLLWNKNNNYFPFYSSLVDRFCLILGIFTKTCIISIPFYAYRWMIEDMTIPINNPKFLGDPWFHYNHSIVPPFFIPHPTYNVKENYDLNELILKIEEDVKDIYETSRMFNILDPRRESNHILYEAYQLDNIKRKWDEDYFVFSKNIQNICNINERELKNQKEHTEFLMLKKI